MKRNRLSEEERNLRGWPSVNEQGLPEVKQKTYCKRKAAMEAYLAGGAIADIEADHGVPLQELQRLLSRCLKTHPDGRINGLRALVPGFRLKAGNTRTKAIGAKGPHDKGGLAGAFGWLFDRYEDIAQGVTDRFLGKVRRGEVGEGVMKISTIHTWMLEALRAKGLTDEDYPFTTGDQGYRSLVTFCQGLFDRYPKEATAARYGKAMARRLGTGAAGTREAAKWPFAQVELDAHRLHGQFILSAAAGRYGNKERTVVRPWVLVLLDRLTRAVLAYLAVWAAEINQYDVLRLFKKAIRPWRLPELTLPGAAYIEGAGMPSEAIPNCAWALWDNLANDNALAFCAKTVKEAQTRVVGGTITYGRYRTPNDQPYIESFFRTLEAQLQRLPNTVGSGPDDPRRQEPERAARTYRLDQEVLDQVLAMTFANYNGTPHSGLGGKTPLQVLKRYLAVDPPRRLIDPRAIERLCLREVRTVRGNLAKGRRPFVQIEHVRYSSVTLGGMPSLIGQRLTLLVDPDALDHIPAYLADGSYLGVLTPKDKQWQRPHTLEERRLFFRTQPKALADPIRETVRGLRERRPLPPERSSRQPKPHPHGRAKGLLERLRKKKIVR